ncbi:MAG TPA: HAD-IA family hydrolase [Candidatus Solibacter sp.]|jgi:HAD superfamily hydrolase (TIGR01509 family)|nr:HAD-IA family hydrolase [Candidatus Solibacter sp.]
MLRALIFDFDGLMVDTESPALHAWQEVYRRHGQELPIDVWAQVIGTNEIRFDAVEHLEGLHGAPLDRESLYAVRDQLKTELTDAQPLLPGVRELLEHARASGIELAVASSSSHLWVDAHLDVRGVLEAFGCIRCRDDVALTKPYPDLYLAALECLGVAASEAVVFEDSPNGIAAARAAGIFVVAVPNAITGTLDLTSANFQVESLAVKPPAELLAELEERLSS